MQATAVCRRAVALVTRRTLTSVVARSCGPVVRPAARAHAARAPVVCARLPAWRPAAEVRAFSSQTEAAPVSGETVVGPAEKSAFQAETRQLLHIVTHSLYSDRHVFLRELVSNASDACEKARHSAVAGAAGKLREPETPLEIRITTDEASRVLTISDSGIGMSKAELVDNLGTIARSGSRAYMAAHAQSAGGAPGVSGSPASGALNIIGQFGVGFYSVFMVADSVKVFSRSAMAAGDGADASKDVAYCWSSTGDGSYEVSEAKGVARGTKIVIQLKETAKEFASPNTVKDIIKRYSNFVNFPIFVNGSQVNTIGALWARGKDEVTDAQYTEFYKYKSGDFEPPLYRLHFTSDAPIALKALLFVGSTHEEKFGMGRMRPGVDLYSRRVLIEAGSRVLPEWLRFLHGVIDSEDIPLNVSRETMQDSALVKRLRSVLTRRVLRFLESEARRDADAYNKKFFTEFGQFLKEGAVMDATYGPDIAKLLRFESSTLPSGSQTSLDEYVSRMTPGQQHIYYLVAPNRSIAESSPYMEAFRGAAKREGSATPSDVEVLFLYSSIDDFVMNNLREFNGRKLMTAETADLKPETLKGVDGKPAEAGAAPSAAAEALTPQQVEELGSWLVATFPSRISKVRATTRLSSSPAVVTEHESAAVRRMMRLVEQSAGRDPEGVRTESHILPPQTLEVNPSHPVIRALATARTHMDAQVRDRARLAAEALLDNALIAAGLVDDPRALLPRLNALLHAALDPNAPVPPPAIPRTPTSPVAAAEAAAVDAAQAHGASVGEQLAQSTP